ncbi:hypothetical protein N781_06245 [Pontibacillus halophilus JSM 076056 = DSM 19796]|uniref:Uncharacterized protein n=1 Tax=Pontibacillus halophilus JSM 076056 = DSM 19796 TaxID=1385510 RepID=A0A0A5I4J7_9BACI|nr:hypothetical protein [Pontibacillus halophilus]KGX90747.1 hypothetical protein N781_06245 [Pontibacillus halophilus JSM 076056 = DSM 19796]
MEWIALLTLSTFVLGLFGMEALWKRQSYLPDQEEARVESYYYRQNNRWYAFVRNEGEGQAHNIRAVIISSNQFSISDDDNFDLDSHEEHFLGTYESPISSIIVRYDDNEREDKLIKGYEKHETFTI